jgi:hypothetical protein
MSAFIKKKNQMIKQEPSSSPQLAPLHEREALHREICEEIRVALEKQELNLGSMQEALKKMEKLQKNFTVSSSDEAAFERLRNMFRQHLDANLEIKEESPPPPFPFSPPTHPAASAFLCPPGTIEILSEILAVLTPTPTFAFSQPTPPPPSAFYCPPGTIENVLHSAPPYQAPFTWHRCNECDYKAKQGEALETCS